MLTPRKTLSNYVHVTDSSPNRTVTMDKSNMDIKIVKIVDPWNFQAIEISDLSKSSSCQEFQVMHEKMNHYCNHLLGAEFFKPNLGDLCAALSPDDNLWHRVRIEGIKTQSSGQQICCFLIDNGSHMTVSTLRLMKLPMKFQELPPQVLQCSLWGVQPVTLKIVLTETGLNAESRPCTKWDPAAVKYMQKIFEESHGCQAEVIKRDPDNLFLKVHLKTSKGFVCFNELLVKENYAVKVDSPDFDLIFKSMTEQDNADLRDTSSSMTQGSKTTILQSVLDEMPTIIPQMPSAAGHASSPRMNFSSPRMNFLLPKMNISPPRMNLSSQRMNLFSQRINFSPPRMNLSSPRMIDNSSFAKNPAYPTDIIQEQSNGQQHFNNDAQEKSKGQSHIINDVQEQSPEQPHFIIDSLKCSPQIKSASNMGATHLKVDKTSPSSEAILCLKSSALERSLITDNRNNNAEITQRASSNIPSPVSSSRLVKMLEKNSPSTSKVTYYDQGKAQGENIHSSPVNNNQSLVNQNDSNNCLLSSSLQTGTIQTQLSPESNKSSFLSCHSPSSLNGIEKSLEMEQDNSIILSGNIQSSPLNCIMLPTATLECRAEDSSFLSALSSSFADDIVNTLSSTNKNNFLNDSSSGTNNFTTSPLATQNNSIFSANSTVNADDTKTSPKSNKISFSNTESMVTVDTNINGQNDKEIIIPTGSSQTNRQSNNHNSTPEIPSNFSTNSNHAVSEHSEKSLTPETKRESVKPTLVTRNELSQSNYQQSVCLSRLQARIHGESQRRGQSSSIPLIARQDRPIPQPILGVLTHGKSVPSFICDVDDVPFMNCVKSVFRELEIDTAMGIQPWVWPAALSCRHIIGISPPNLGKTMAYVPAIVSKLMDRISYSDLPQGKGPIALVIVPSWKKGRDVLEKVKQFTNLHATSEYTSRKQIKSQVLYAGGVEENNENQVALIEGCDILIATPSSLLRMLDQDFTSLKRLCHLVLDDSEILASRYATEIEAIMQQYKLQLKNRKEHHRCTDMPRQIMVFASKWTSEVEKFYLKYTVEPVIVISSRVEASVYGGVKQVVTLTKLELKLKAFCNILDTLSSTNQCVAVFTQELREAEILHKAVISRGISCLLMHEELKIDDMEDVRQQWFRSSRSKQLTIVVCTDVCYQDLAITNANMVIHYRLPDSKTKFGNRLACMMDYFLDRTSNVKPEFEPVSQVIVTNKCGAEAESLYDILERCPSEFSPQLKQFILGRKMELEKDPTKKLCPFLKSFGICSNQDSCRHRHQVIPEQDFKTGDVSQNTLPASGQVKIKIIRVENASCYHCHLVSHRSVPGSVRTDLRLEYQKLVLEMVLFYSKESNHVPFIPSDEPFYDNICAIREMDNIFHRAKVLSVHRGTYNVPMLCKVWLVDAGYYKTVSIDQLVRLPQRLAEVPYQAIEVYLCGVKPMDNDAEWTFEGNTFMNDLIFGKELVGRIMLRVGLTLWLLPLVHEVTLKHVGVASDINVKQELLSRNLGTLNPKHIQNLYELFRGIIEIPEKLMRQYFNYALRIEMLQETLPDDDKFYDVIIAAVVNPGLLYVQKWDNFDLLEKLEAQIADKMRIKENNDDMEESKADADVKLEPGSVCLALSADGRWYRAKVISDNASGLWLVFFLDYGDRENVPVGDIRPLPRELAELPCQAIECELAYIQPQAEKWEQTAVDAICDLAYFLNGEKKQLSAKVVSKLNPVYGIGEKLAIDLYNDNNVRFSQELVWRQIAKSDGKSDILKNLMEKPAIKNQLFFITWDKIPYLCANIYCCDIHSDTIQQANELCHILSIRDESWDSNILQRNVLQSVFTLIGYIPNLDAHAIILDSLVSCCLDSARLIEVAIEENWAFQLASCLEQVSRPTIQLQAAQAVSRLVTTNSFCDSLTSNDYLLTMLVQFLKQHPTSQVDLETLKCVCSASTQLVLTDESVSAELISAEMVQHIFSTLQQTPCDTKKEQWLKLLAAIATWESTHNSIMREAHVATLMALLLNSSCCKCLYYLLSICQSLVQYSRRHKVVLLENKLMIILNDLEAEGLRSPALELCKHLQADLALTIPEPESLAGIPVHQVTEVNKITTPQVAWSQNSFKVVLNIAVRGAKVDDFIISDSKICCRCVSDGTQYELDWELYDTVIPGRSKVQVYASYSLVSLWKQKKEIWSRLLKQKIKPPSLSHDCEHPYDSAEEEDVEDDTNITTLTRKKDIFNQEQIWKLKRTKNYESSEESSDELAYYSHSSDDEPDIDVESFMRGIMS